MTEGRTRLRFSFRFTISAVLIGLIVLLAGALMAASWHFGTRSITTLVDQILVRSGGHVVDRARSYTDPAQKAAKLSDELARSQVIQTGRFRQLEDYFLRVMAVYEQIAMLNYGNEHGDFLMTKHFPDDMEMEAHLLVPNPSGDCRAGGMWDDVEPLVDQPGFCPGPLRPARGRMEPRLSSAEALIHFCSGSFVMPPGGWWPCPTGGISSTIPGFGPGTSW